MAEKMTKRVTRKSSASGESSESGEPSASRKPNASRKPSAELRPDRLDLLIESVRAFRDEREWRQFHTPKDLAVSISIEAAELLEHFQWRTDSETAARLADPVERAAVGREMADVLLLLLSAADVVGVDLHDAAVAKLRENAEKYPVDKARGRSDKYDRL